MRNLIDCPACRRPLRLPDERRGELVECPECRHRFVAEFHSVLPADAVVAALPETAPRRRASAQAREAAAAALAKAERDERTAPTD